MTLRAFSLLATLAAALASFAAEPAPRTTYLGAMTITVPPALSAQLKLTPGLGLLVVSVELASPAGAVLRPDDVLLRLDDQKLVEVNQLAVLLRTYQPSDEVTLTYLRDGAERQEKVSLIGREAPAPGSVTAGPRSTLLPGATIGGAGGGWGNGSSGFTFSFGPRGEESNVRLSDPSGSIEIATTGGKKTVTARGTDGAVVFSGPYNTPAEREAAPASVRARVEEADRRISIGRRVRGLK